MIDYRKGKKMIKCQKCNGLGTIAEYAHIDNGLCFQCKGTGIYKPLNKAQSANQALNQKVDDILLDWYQNNDNVARLTQEQRGYASQAARELYAKYLSEYGIRVNNLYSKKFASYVL